LGKENVHAFFKPLPQIDAIKKNFEGAARKKVGKKKVGPHKKEEGQCGVSQPWVKVFWIAPEPTHQGGEKRGKGKREKRSKRITKRGNLFVGDGGKR